jgi:hypothetical protein
MSADGFSQYLAVFLRRTLEIKLLFASIKSFNNCEHPASNTLQGTCFGFPLDARDSKSRSKSRL